MAAWMFLETVGAVLVREIHVRPARISANDLLTGLV